MCCPYCSRFALVFALIGIALLTAARGPAADDKANEGWDKLFNGQDLDGWQQHGGKANAAAHGVDVAVAALNTHDTIPLARRARRTRRCATTGAC